RQARVVVEAGSSSGALTSDPCEQPSGPFSQPFGALLGRCVFGSQQSQVLADQLFPFGRQNHVVVRAPMFDRDQTVLEHDRPGQMEGNHRALETIDIDPEPAPVTHVTSSSWIKPRSNWSTRSRRWRISGLLVVSATPRSTPSAQ